VFLFSPVWFRTHYYDLGSTLLIFFEPFPLFLLSFFRLAFYVLPCVCIFLNFFFAYCLRVFLPFFLHCLSFLLNFTLISLFRCFLLSYFISCLISFLFDFFLALFLSCFHSFFISFFISSCVCLFKHVLSLERERNGCMIHVKPRLKYVIYIRLGSTVKSSN